MYDFLIDVNVIEVREDCWHIIAFLFKNNVSKITRFILCVEVDGEGSDGSISSIATHVLWDIQEVDGA